MLKGGFAYATYTLESVSKEGTRTETRILTVLRNHSTDGKRWKIAVTNLPT
jgi:hypothetical protein